ncbi:MAG: ABC transporter permease [Anaerolineae bacterium]
MATNDTRLQFEHRPGLSEGARLWRSLRHAPLALFGLVIVTTIVALGLTAPFLAPYDPEFVSIQNRLNPPVWTLADTGSHLLGTDNLGRDILSRLLWGARVSLFVGLSTVFLGGILGTLLGFTAGYLGGWFDTLIMRLVDIQLAFPSMLFAVAIMAILGPSLGNVVLVLSLTTWATYCRIARGQTLSLREMEFVEAARSMGSGHLRIILRHVLPNAVSPLIVVASFGVANNIINEASLSFLGVGVPPTVPTWGGMLGEGRTYLRLAWWTSTFPGMALMFTVFGVNVLGDWLRDYLDPQLRTL